MEAKPNTDMAVELPINSAAASLVLPGDDAPSLKTFSLDSYADDEAQHARYITQPEDRCPREVVVKCIS